MRKNVKLLIAGVLMTVSVCTAQGYAFAAAAPDFSLEEATQGMVVSLNTYQSKQPVLLLFWTTWCPFCQKALRQLNDLYPQLHEKGMEVMAINVGEGSHKVAAAIERYGLRFPVLLDGSQTVSRNYELFGVPTYVLIDRDGNIVFKVNSFPGKQLNDFLGTGS